MWAKATELNGNIVWLNLALARSIVRLAYETANGYDAKTVIVFDSNEQWTVIERPETLLAYVGAQFSRSDGATDRPPPSQRSGASK